jgi:putative alpha-1,2-mannosidase
VFQIEVKNQGDKNVYIDKVLLNGQPLTRPFLKHAEIMAGGQLQFIMKDKPNKKLFIQKNLK